MEVKVTMTTSDVERFTTESVVIQNKDKILFNGKEFNTQTTAPVYAGFADTAIRLSALKEGISHFRTVNSSNKELVDWVTIYRTPKTEPLFEPFKRTGMYLSRIMCGVCFQTGTMYTGTKLCKEFGRTSEIVRGELFAYLYSIVKFVRDWQEKPCVSTVGYMGKYDIGESDTDFVKRLPTFSKTDSTFYIKDSSSDDVDIIKYSNSAISSIQDAFAPAAPLQFAVLSEDKSQMAVVAIKVGSTTYTFCIGKGVVKTDYDLCLLELSSDTICTALAAAYGQDVIIQHVDRTALPITDQHEYVDCDSPEDLMGRVETWLSKWCAHMLARGSEYAGDGMLTHLKTFGVKLGDTGMFGDPDAIKETYKDDEYAQELYKQVKPYYSTFDLGSVSANVKGFSSGALYSMAFIGESGTGKSTAARVLPSRCGLPYVSVNFSVNIEESDLFGAMIPNPHKKSAEDPEFVWQDGIVTKAVRNGYCVVLEEINFARPGVLGKLNSLLDENRQIDLSNGEIIRAHENFRIIATCNIAYEGTNRFNKALINRFDDVTVFRDPAREDALKIIKERTGYSNASKMSKVYDVYEALKKFSKEQGVQAVVSMRQLLNIFTKGKYYKDAKDAVTRIMLNGAFIEDSEYQQVFEDTVLPAFDLKFKI